MTELRTSVVSALAGSPHEQGVIDAIVRRPAVGERELLDEAELDETTGVVGDNWSTRGSSRTEDGSAHPEMQLTLINSRAIAAIAGGTHDGPRDRWWLAGDQFYVDLDLSEENLPAGTRLKMGDTEVEISSVPHTGCGKFAERYGLEAAKLVNSPEGRAMRLRGVNARVIEGGTVRVGDPIGR